MIFIWKCLSYGPVVDRLLCVKGERYMYIEEDKHQWEPIHVLVYTTDSLSSQV